VNRLNQLEQQIVAAEDGAEDARWQQGAEVVRRLDRGESERDIAASWVNGRTGKAYSQKHVNRCATLWHQFGESAPTQRPSWATEYAALDVTTRSERAQAQAPTTVPIAEKLVDNLVDKKTPKAVFNALVKRLVKKAPEVVGVAVARDAAASEAYRGAKFAVVEEAEHKVRRGALSNWWSKVEKKMRRIQTDIADMAALVDQGTWTANREVALEEWKQERIAEIEALHEQKGEQMGEDAQVVNIRRSS